MKVLIEPFNWDHSRSIRLTISRFSFYAAVHGPTNLWEERNYLTMIEVHFNRKSAKEMKWGFRAFYESPSMRR